ncbi:MAG: hypothetical protein K0U39_09465 [Alphaproteobacteria bacterium]|nr:hypothetical protein [Alphaproteobacteria bacterium]
MPQNIKKQVNDIGKKSLVNWLEAGINHYEKSLVKKMREKEPNLAVNSCGIKVAGIYQIISEGRIVEALDEVIASEKVASEIIEKAKQLKKKYSQ